MATPTTKLNAFPIFLRVEGGLVVIVGGGEEARQSPGVPRDQLGRGGLAPVPEGPDEVGVRGTR